MWLGVIAYQILWREPILEAHSTGIKVEEIYDNSGLNLKHEIWKGNWEMKEDFNLSFNYFFVFVGIFVRDEAILKDNW